MAENGNHSSVKKLESNADQNGVIQPLLTGQDRYAFSLISLKLIVSSLPP